MESHLVLAFISTVLVTAVLGQGVHLELHGDTIANNSVVSAYDIPTTTDDPTLRCVTEREDCCSSPDNANWFAPSGEVAEKHIIRYLVDELGGAEGSVNLYRSHTAVVDVQEGLYHCIILSPDDEISTLYVGLYTSDNGGRPTISGITYNQLSSEMFTLTCTSTGGPATTVTWTLNGSVITYDANHVLTQTVVNTTTAEYNNTLTVTGREPESYQCTVSNARGNDTSQKLAVVNNTGTPNPSSFSPPPEDVTIMSSVNPSNTPDPSSSSQLLVAIAGAAVGLVLCIILIVVLILALTVYKRRKGTWPWGKKTQGQHNLQQFDDTRSSVNQKQPSQSTGQTVTAQAVGGAIRNETNSHVVNTTYISHSLHTITDSSDPLYSAVTDATTQSVNPLVTEPPIPIKCIHSSTSIFTHDEDDQTVGKNDESTFEGDLSSTKQENTVKDEPKTSSGSGDVYAVVNKSKKVKRSAQSESRADSITMKTVGPARTSDVYAVVHKKVKKKNKPPPLPAPYQDEL